MLLFVVFDLREVVRQLDENRIGIAILAIVVVLIHLAALGVAGAMVLGDGASRGNPSDRDQLITLFGVLALTFMMAMYALERRGRGFILAFAVGCALSSVYGFASGAWPFGVVEAIWCLIALRRFASTT
jgi:uncharacterized protein YhhL (DUF1145 family)